MRWLAGLVALLVAGVVAGCAEPEAEDAPSVTGAPEKERLSRPGGGGADEGDDDEDEVDRDWDNATVFSYSDVFDLQVTASSSFVSFSGFIDGQGCVRVTGTPFRILEGNATVTWVAQTPAAEELSFVTRQVFGDYYFEEWAGRSPLEAEIGELPTAEDDSYFTFAVDAGSLATVAYDQEVHVALSFEYEAFEEVAVTWGC